MSILLSGLSSVGTEMRKCVPSARADGELVSVIFSCSLIVSLRKAIRFGETSKPIVR